MSEPRRGWTRLVAPSLVLAALAAPAGAEHEANHRYIVEGRVLSADRSPRPGVSVTLSADGRLLGVAETGGDGSYRIQAHLHDEDIGRKLQLKTATGSGTIAMQATHGDATSRRGHRASFVGGELVAEEPTRPVLPVWAYFAAAIAAVTAAVAGAGAYRRRNRRRERQALAAERRAKGGSSRASGRRAKRRR